MCINYIVEHKYIHLDSCGKLVVLRIESSDTIKIIKESVQEKIKVPCDQQEIIFEGEILQDDYIVSNYNIQYSKLKVVLTIIGKNRNWFSRHCSCWITVW